MKIKLERDELWPYYTLANEDLDKKYIFAKIDVTQEEKEMLEDYIKKGFEAQIFIREKIRALGLEDV